jgi:putative transposase
MTKRRTAEQIGRLLREANRDLAKGLTVADVCRKLGITENSYYRWRQQHDPARVDDTRRVRELETEVERLKLLVAELLLDKKMLQEVAKKNYGGKLGWRVRDSQDFSNPQLGGNARKPADFPFPQAKFATVEKKW